MKAKPILKWVGGKRQMSSLIVKIIKDEFLFNNKENRYFEPFFGGGAVFFDLNPKTALLNDLNEEIINLMMEIKCNHDNLIKKFIQLENEFLLNGENFYYKVREMDRSIKYNSIDNLTKAARMLFLNKFGFNGLYRVNSNGYFNVPVGKPSSGQFKKDSNVIINLKAMSLYLNQQDKQFEFVNGDFSSCLAGAKKGDVVYFDPPYDKLESDSFTSYTKNGFTKNDTKKLKIIADDLVNRGVNVIISNNSTDYVLKLFSNSKTTYTVSYVDVTWTVNPDASKKKNITEVIIYNSNFISNSKIVT